MDFVCSPPDRWSRNSLLIAVIHSPWRGVLEYYRQLNGLLSLTPHVGVDIVDSEPFASFQSQRTHVAAGVMAVLGLTSIDVGGNYDVGYHDVPYEVMQFWRLIMKGDDVSQHPLYGVLPEVRYTPHVLSSIDFYQNEFYQYCMTGRHALVRVRRAVKKKRVDNKRARGVVGTKPLEELGFTVNR